jgi:hypothetical protein
VFEFACATRIVAGASAVDRAGALASELGRRAIVIADAELFASGRITALAPALQQAGVGLLGSIEVGPASKPRPPRRLTGRADGLCPTSSSSRAAIARSISSRL